MQPVLARPTALPGAPACPLVLTCLGAQRRGVLPCGKGLTAVEAQPAEQSSWISLFGFPLKGFDELFLASELSGMM